MNEDDAKSVRLDIAVGDRVLVVGGHPWSGHAGTVARLEEWLGKPALRVELDNGMACGARPNQLRVINDG